MNRKLPDGKGGFQPCPDLMTEEEVIRLLRIPEIVCRAVMNPFKA